MHAVVCSDHGNMGKSHLHGTEEATQSSCVNLYITTETGISSISKMVYSLSFLLPLL